MLFPLIPAIRFHIQFLYMSLRFPLLLIIHPDEVDGVLCKNADHGLGLDFFKFFEIVIPSLDKVLGQPKLDIQFPTFASLLQASRSNISVKFSIHRLRMNLTQLLINVKLLFIQILLSVQESVMKLLSRSSRNVMTV